jgi:plastocyanin
MKFFVIILAAAICHVRAGTIVGTVRAEGKPALDQGPKGGKYDSRKFKFVEKVKYDELTDFVVYIDQPVTNAPPFKPKMLQVITQRDAVFRPHVLPVQVGSTVQWPNKDEIYHNVFSMSESNPFDLGLYKDPDVRKVEFKKPGRVDVFCSIHAQMNCVILVLQNPWFATVDPSGRFKIENVPPGAYKLKAWHERVPAEVKEVVVPKEGVVEVDFVLGVKGLPTY